MKTILTGLAMCFSIMLSAQTVRQGEVQSIIHFSDYDIVIVEDVESSIIYKSSAFDSGLIEEADILKMIFTDDNLTQAKSILNNRETILLKIIEEQITSDDILSMVKMPEVVDGIMHFDSKEHLASVRDLIDIIIIKAPDVQEMDDVLDVFENMYSNYNSYRTKRNVDSNRINGGFTEVELDELYNSEFVHDAIIRTFLNSDLLVGIGSDVIMWFGENIDLTVDEEDTELVQVLIDLSEDGDISQLAPVLREYDKIDFYSPTYNIGATKDVFTLDWMHEFKSEQIVHSPHCDGNTKKVKVDVKYHHDFWVQGDNGNTLSSSIITTDTSEGDLLVDWGDGTVEIFENYQSGDWESHTYSEDFQNADDFVIFTSIVFNSQEEDFNGDQIILEDESEFLELTIDCTNDEDGFDWYDETNGIYKLRYKVWHSENSIVSQIGAYSESFRFISGEWKRKTANLTVYVFGTFYDSNCGDPASKDGGENRNRKDIQKVKNKFQQHKNRKKHIDDDIYSVHSLNKNGTSITIPFLGLNPCD